MKIRRITIALSLVALVGYGCMRNKPPVPSPPPSNAVLGNSGSAPAGQGPTGAEVVATPSPSGTPPVNGTNANAPSAAPTWFGRFCNWMKAVDGRETASNRHSDDDHLHEIYAD